MQGTLSKSWLTIGFLHTDVEHLAATFLRNHPTWADQIVYWGPMGCLTGNYLLMKGDLESKDIVELMKETFRFIAEYEGVETNISMTAQEVACPQEELPEDVQDFLIHAICACPHGVFRMIPENFTLAPAKAKTD